MKDSEVVTVHRLQHKASRTELETSENGITRYIIEEIQHIAQTRVKELRCTVRSIKGHKGLATENLKICIGHSRVWISYDGVCCQHGLSIEQTIAI